MDKKVERVMDFYKVLTAGKTVNKTDAMEAYHVSERTIMRDMDDIRAYLANGMQFDRDVVYDRETKSFFMTQTNSNNLTNSEILMVCKILLESRSLVKDEMFPIIDKLIASCVPDEKKQKVTALIANEKFHYMEPHHGKKFVQIMWDLGTAVFENRLLKIHYRKLTEPDCVDRLLQPVGIMFSEFYFYLCAFKDGSPDSERESYPCFYRVDRIEDYEVTEQHFKIPYAERFEEGELRKRIQFMFGGELRTIRFWYRGLSIEAVLDRLPTAKVIRQDENGFLVQAEVFGDGVDMWLRSQGDNIEMI